MRLSSSFFLFIITIAFLGINCKSSDGAAVFGDDCSGPLHRWPMYSNGGFESTILHPGDPAWVLQTPSAAGDCTSSYYFIFRWANSAKQNDTLPPPIDVTFSPSGSAGSQIPQKDGAVAPYPGKGWWLIGFSPTPTSTGGNTTKFTITAKNTTADSVEVDGQIHYRLSGE